MLFTFWTRCRSIIAVACALTVVPAVPVRSASLATITGTVRTAAGTAVAGATVVARGPSRATTKTDAMGAFTVFVVRALMPRPVA